MDNPGDTLGFKTPGGFDAVHPAWIYPSDYIRAKQPGKL
jgi:hypothetical protein